MGAPFSKDHMEKPKILIACNTLTSISGEVYPYHMKLFYHLGRRQTDYDFMQLFAARMSIDRFRNWAATAAQVHKCKYLIFIDDDMKLAPDAIDKLIDGVVHGGYHILAALNYIRGYPFKIMSFKFDLTSNRKRLINLNQDDVNAKIGEIIPCDAIGTAVCMIDVDVFRQIPKPYFLTGPHGTEDIYMCCKAKELIPGCKIGTHTGVQTGHLIEQESISHETRAPLMRFYESFMTEEQVTESRMENPGIAITPNVGKRDLYYEDIMGMEFEPVIQR